MGKLARQDSGVRKQEIPIPPLLPQMEEQLKVFRLWRGMANDFCAGLIGGFHRELRFFNGKSKCAWRATARK